MSSAPALEKIEPHAADETRPALPCLDLDALAFQEQFPQRPFLIGHHLVRHPLFALPRLVELSRCLPETSVEYNAGNVPISLDPRQTPYTGLSVAESIRRIEECQSWLVLKHVEQDPEYRELLLECLGEVESLGHPLIRGVCKREGFIFVSSPGSVTPYHMDSEHNFLLQIRGSKTIHMFDAADRSILMEEELEKHYSGGHRNLAYKEEYERKARVFELTPGQGLHFPVTAPHWVKNGDAVSISFSITFQTRATERRATIYSINHYLRSRGYQPTPFGDSPLRDSIKYNAYRLVRRLKSLLPVREARPENAQ